jgi:hypothetical protein
VFADDSTLLVDGINGSIPYSVLSGAPTIPAAQVQSNWTAASGMGVILNKPTLFSGSYTDLTNKPTAFSFSVAADDSTQRLISTDEVIKFIGSGGITTASDAEGNITINYVQGNIRSEGNINIDINLSDSTLRRWQFGEDGALTFPNGTNQTTAWTGSTTVSSLVNGAYTVSLGADGKLTSPGNITSQTLTLSNGSAGYESQLFVHDSNNNRILFRNYNNRQSVAGYDYSSYTSGIVVDTGGSGYSVVSGQNSGSSAITSLTFDFRTLANGTSAQRMGVLRFDSGVDNGPSLSNAVSMKYFPTTSAESNGTYYEFATTGLRFPDTTVQSTAYTGLIPNSTKASTATGTAGQTSFDSNYFYVCIATNTWRRVALGSSY